MAKSACSEPGRVRARRVRAVRASVPSAAPNGVGVRGCARYSARGRRAPVSGRIAPIWVVPRESLVPMWGAVFLCGKGMGDREDIRHDQKGFNGSRFSVPREGGDRAVEGARRFPPLHRPARRSGCVYVLRWAAHGQRQAAYRPHPDPRDEGPDPPLPDHERQESAAQGRLGYARPSCGAGSGKAARPGWQGAD